MHVQAQTKKYVKLQKVSKTIFGEYTITNNDF